MTTERPVVSRRTDVTVAAVRVLMPSPFKGVLDRRGDLRLVGRGEPAGRLGDGDPDTERGEQLAQLQTDRVPTDHQHGFRLTPSAA